MRYTTAILATLAATTLANPLNPRDGTPFKVTAEQIGTLAPKSKSCDKSKSVECAPADKAAEYINNSFQTYKITTAGAAAGLIATMIQETGQFEFARNKVPGVKGQGTRNMQSPKFNKMYLDSLTEPAFADEKKAAGDDPAKVLDAIIKYGNYDFGSAAWFLTTQCKDNVAGLDKGDAAGWDAYVTCVGATATDGRKDVWTKAIALLKPS